MYNIMINILVNIILSSLLLSGCAFSTSAYSNDNVRNEQNAGHNVWENELVKERNSLKRRNFSDYEMRRSSASFWLEITPSPEALIEMPFKNHHNQQADKTWHEYIERAIRFYGR
jgi:hypothetical protein